MSWPGKIKSGKSDFISANWDLMPTLADIIQVAIPANTDGISLYSTIFDVPEEQTQHPYLYWEFHEQGGKQAVRMGKWKAVKTNAGNPSKMKVELYDLEKDASEKTDVSLQHPDIVKTMTALMNTAGTPDKAFRF
jgi:arylsulfatase A-like enzyme